ncbi:traJ protein [Pseudomonas syringae]|uniref:TraJ protein n=2 Tax=Pseudomonas syringae TaxID=317 RepID=A0A6B2ANT9_PSESX|nr:traJ protein [Pseudomonas syringae pv. pisi str. PP1]NAO30740.1 traJ protein [Pseudomonas syringae]NAO40967.1 traJ protein [Pseudomonas syringae]NAO46268.1 traJ protein [Pseudomonas syringae]NAO59565.1 traJ protein [Pseudomonas syringae]
MESITLWLAEKRGESANSIDVESLMMEFWRLQVAIGMKMGTIVKVHK